jgi:hypothetical protein
VIISTKELTPQEERNAKVAWFTMDRILSWAKNSELKDEEDCIALDFLQSIFPFFVEKFTDDLLDEYFPYSQEDVANIIETTSLGHIWEMS